MRILPAALLALTLAAPAAMAETVVIEQPGHDGYHHEMARHEWHQARRAEHVARWRAANGDYAGAARAQAYADRARVDAHRDVHDHY